MIYFYFYTELSAILIETILIIMMTSFYESKGKGRHLWNKEQCQWRKILKVKTGLNSVKENSFKFKD